MLWRPIEAISPIPIASFCTNGTRSPALVAGGEVGGGDDMRLNGKRQRTAIGRLPGAQPSHKVFDPRALILIPGNVAQLTRIRGEVIELRLVVAKHVQLPAVGGDDAASIVIAALAVGPRHD